LLYYAALVYTNSQLLPLLGVINDLSNQLHEVKTAVDEANIQLSNNKPFIELSVDLAHNLDQAWITSDSRVKNACCIYTCIV